MSSPSMVEFEKQFPESHAAIRVIAVGQSSEEYSVRFYDISQMGELIHDIRSFVFINSWRMDVSSVDVEMKE